MASRNFMPSRYLRRFPVYLLLDCSGSMLGEPATAMSDGLEIIYRLLMDDPEALERVYICLITFAEVAEVEPLVAIDDFRPPTLAASGKTAMGAALWGLAESIQEDLLPNTAEQRGDYRPLVFLITDGAPTDDYRQGLKRLKALTRHQPLIIALGCGPDADIAVLQEVTEKDKVFLMQTFTSQALHQYFKWISDAVIISSRAVNNSTSQGAVIPPPTTIPGIFPSHS